MQIIGILRLLNLWRVKYINHRQFIIFLSIVIGILSGFIAIVIKNAVHLIRSLLIHGFSVDYYNFLYFLYPALGILAVIIFTRYILKRHVEHGIPNVLNAISNNKGIIDKHNLFSSIVTSAFTVGFGGSVGLEGPTVATGAAFGSNIGRHLKFNYKDITLLLGCASAGAMSAIFKAPIAAVVFALEVIMLDLTMASIVPLIIASATAALTSYFFLGQDILLYSAEFHDKFNIGNIHFYILLGVFTGLVSVYFTRIYKFLNRMFDSIRSWVSRLIMGGALLGLLIFVFPSLYGEGYNVINAILRGEISYLFDNTFYAGFQDNLIVVLILFCLIIFFKAIATSITFASGGVGGVFAPTLFLGANAGLLFSKVFNLFGFRLSDSNFALVGMGGLIAGVIHAPMTGIFLIAEITNGYDLFMPLMITATISYVTIKVFEKGSVYTYQLLEQGELITHDKDKATFHLLDIDDLLEKDFVTLKPDNTLGELVNAIMNSKRNVFPVVDDENTMVGILTLNDVRNLIFKQELYNKTYIRNVMYFPETYVSYYDTLEQIANKIEASGRYNVPVLKDGKYLGFISRAKVFSAYRKFIKDFSEE